MMEKGKSYTYSYITENLFNWREKGEGGFVIGVNKLTFTKGKRIMIFVLDGYANQGIYKLIEETPINGD